MLLLSLVFVAMALFIGAIVVRAISIIPLSILARAAEGGRYVRLGLSELSSPATPSGGRRSPASPGAHGVTFRMAGAKA